MSAPALNKTQRAADLRNMEENDLDILVVGGGVTGAGIAFDAALRGLRVGIIDAQDWAAGTSSRSSKLIHGGLRYLYQLDFKLVHEALTERGLLLDTTAPHLVKKMPLLWPFKQRVIERAYSTCGVGMYDAMAQMAHPGSVPIQHHVTRTGALRLVPDLKKDALIGGMVYYDARVDDARLVVTLVRSAQQFGALAASRTQMIGMTYDASGRVNAAIVEDLETGEKHTIRCHTIINATGVWTENSQALSGKDSGLKVLTSKGIHIVVPKERIKGHTGMFVRTEKSVLFIIPWKRYWIIGTTDTKYAEDYVNPVANSEDINYVLAEANTVLDKPLTRDDIISTFAGLRPLLMPGTKGDTASTKVSREHTVTEAVPGLVVIAGGKLTTYRPMAEDAVNFALGKRAKKMPSLTKRTPLRGAAGYKGLWNQRDTLAKEHNLSRDHVEDMLDRYGDDITLIFDLIAENPSLAKELEHAPEYLRAEVYFGVAFEGAMHVEDMLCQRIRLTYEHRDRGRAAAAEVAEIMGDYLGWSKEEKTKEVEMYCKRCDAEDAATLIDDEAEAQAARDHIGDAVHMHDLPRD